MPILETTDLTRRFGAFTAVDRLTLAVEAGEVFGLLGANGAGKTVTIKMLTTLLPPTSGNARVAGFDIRHQAAEVRRVIGYVPQMISADGALTGYENLLIFAKLYDIPRAERAARITGALAFMDLEDVAGKLVRDYSGGMIRRLEIAQSMLHRPRVLFLDEPTVGLDPVARAAVWEHVERLRVEYGATIVLTTHLMDEAEALCRRVAIMHRGRVMVMGTPDELKASVPGGGATMDDVFSHYAEGAVERGGTYSETARARRTARRLG
jgi:ABC-2 type transport system ATP-binding protein